MSPVLAASSSSARKTASVVRLLPRSLLEDRSGGVGGDLDVGDVGRVFHQCADALFCAFGDFGRSLEQLAQVLAGTALLNDLDQAFEGLVKFRLGVHRVELIASSGGAVAATLFEHGDLVHEDCAGDVALGLVVLGTQPVQLAVEPRQ